MQTSVVGYPRIGESRELKFVSERYYRGEATREELRDTAASLRSAHWKLQQERGIDFIPSNDFSLYDGVLDMACLLNIIPERYKQLGLDALETSFAMARGYQGERGDVKALAMKKWFNTNYHYMVPELDRSTEIRLVGTKPFDEYEAAKRLGVQTKPVLIGAFTLLKLAKYSDGKQASDFVQDIIQAYQKLLERLQELGAEWVQFDEPMLVTDLSSGDIALIRELYTQILSAKGKVNVLAQTYFGDVRDVYQQLVALPFDGIGLDLVEGRDTLQLIEQHGFPKDKTLFAGVVNGKNIWRNRYTQTLELVGRLQRQAPHIVLSTSCSLLHVPYTVRHETKLSEDVVKHLAFAEEKLQELAELGTILSEQDRHAREAIDHREIEIVDQNERLFYGDRSARDVAVGEKTAALTASDFTRTPEFAVREKLQQERLQLPPLPTTTIGSFPQTADVRANRAAYKKGRIREEQYTSFIQEKIAACITLQEEIGLDVLVHGEYERNDMVEYFGECLEGFIFTEKAWVQSYGTRCVKPPIIWGDISRRRPITVEYSVYAQSLTEKPVKGMLTGPVTILNWSFPREDLSLQETAYQIALAIREEVLDLESHGIGIIQIDEAALREKLPLRRSDWQCEYLEWAIPAFRLVHSGVQPETQIHTHMCYSEFADIIHEIDAMDADVITFEASRSDLELIDTLQRSGFRTEVGPGVYDIHSPRIPSVEEIEQTIRRMLISIEPAKLWVNPDCGLKTRGEAEVRESLVNMVQAVREVRKRDGRR